MKKISVISKTYFQTDLSMCTVSLKHENEGWKDGQISSGSQFIAIVNLVSAWREWTEIDNDVMLEVHCGLTYKERGSEYGMSICMDLQWYMRLPFDTTISRCGAGSQRW